MPADGRDTLPFVGFKHVVLIYAIGWFITAASMMISMYRKNDPKKLREELEEKVCETPELAEHWNENEHNIRSKMTLLVASFFIFFPIMFGSIWPVIWTIRIVNLLRRNDSGEPS